MTGSLTATLHRWQFTPLRWLLICSGLACLVACSGRPTPAPVVEVYQGKSYRDFEPNALQGDTYVVTKGDTLFSIAWYSGNDYRDLARINNIAPPYSIFPGQKITLKLSESRKKKVNKLPGPTTKTKANQTVDPQSKQAYGESQPVKKPTQKSSPGSAFPERVRQWVWPAKGTISAGNYVKETGNKSLEIAGSQGDPVVAAADGKVVYTGDAMRGYGQLIIVKHSDSYLSAYAHNDEILVKEQQWIKAGQRIASMGRTGTDKVKLRFEVRYRGKSVDPLRYLPKP